MSTLEKIQKFVPDAIDYMVFNKDVYAIKNTNWGVHRTGTTSVKLGCCPESGRLVDEILKVEG